MKLPSEIYLDFLNERHLQQDEQQLLVLKSFDDLQKKLPTSTSFLSKIKNLNSAKTPQGIYLWGTVGIGKTFLMDCFFNSLVTMKKRRIHFHHFMQEIHLELQRYTGHSDPLSLVAKSICANTEVLCLDEFFVSDIVDAMVLAGLLKALFERGICFVTTSNIPPAQLYKDGLQRASFLPAIALLEQTLEVIHLMSDTDYRLRHLTLAGVYYTPLNAMAEKKMEEAFAVYSYGRFSVEPITILGRAVTVVKSCEEAIWFSFDVLCGEMRSKEDYLEIAQKFPLVFLSEVPVLTQRSLDEVTRFIRMIDIFYDAKIKLVISAEAIPQALYTEGKLFFDFQRIISRLIEMQSEEYFEA